ncbi:hypothetical protein [Wolbachia endosymbiont of Oedothorax gibbosus]|uniref:hypothetical protein n=1 Tax=Wolbachia endosymbiont of Oedothorax gibbosus TaxID=931100 RepID=UPI0020256481|nr:hypothetical protein [Wolbachia endosymbiont of Oedothorax gibbosus]
MAKDCMNVAITKAISTREASAPFFFIPVRDTGNFIKYKSYVKMRHFMETRSQTGMTRKGATWMTRKEHWDDKKRATWMTPKKSIGYL